MFKTFRFIHTRIIQNPNPYPKPDFFRIQNSVIIENSSNVNARYLAHALLPECSFISACATLSGRRRNFFLVHALHMGKIYFFRLFRNFRVFFVAHALLSEKIDLSAWALI